MSSSDDDGFTRASLLPTTAALVMNKGIEERHCLPAERHLMVLLCALCGLLNYADRVNMSVCIISMSQEFHFSVTQQGAIMSSFFWGYVPSQFAAALLCRRVGAKRVLALGAAFWSLFTALTPIAARSGVPALLACRVGMGLAEGVAFPSIYHFFGTWVPARERGRAMAALSTGVGAGTTIALVLSPEIIRQTSWQTVFFSFGAAGGVWLAAWLLLARDAPAVHSNGRSAPVIPPRTVWISKSERRALSYIAHDRGCLAQIGTQFLSGLFHYTVLSWLPSYFKNVYNMAVEDVWFTFVPYLCMTLFSFVGGALSDHLAARTRSLSVARKSTTALACTGAGVMVIAFAAASGYRGALAAISLSLALFALNAGGFDAAYLDMAEPMYAGLLKSVANTFGAMSGAIAVAVAALLLQWSGSWRFVFCMQAIWVFTAAAVFSKWGSTTCVLTEARFENEMDEKM